MSDGGKPVEIGPAIKTLVETSVDEKTGGAATVEGAGVCHYEPVAVGGNGRMKPVEWPTRGSPTAPDVRSNGTT